MASLENRQAGICPGAVQADSDDSIWLADERGWVARFDLQDRFARGLNNRAGLQTTGLEVAILSGDSSER